MRNCTHSNARWWWTRSRTTRRHVADSVDCWCSRIVQKASDLRDEEHERLTILCDFLAEEILKCVPHAIVTGADAERAPHILNIQFPNIDGDTLVLYFDAHGVRVSSQSACDSESGERSHVLSALNVPDAHGTVRFSFGRSTTKKDLEYTVEVLKKILPLI